MDAIEQRAREIYAAQFPGDCGYDTRKWIMEGTWGDDEVIAAIVTALTPPGGWVSPDDLLEAQDRAFYDGMSKCACPIPEGYVLVPVEVLVYAEAVVAAKSTEEDLRALQLLESALLVANVELRRRDRSERLQAMLAARPEVP